MKKKELSFKEMLYNVISKGEKHDNAFKAIVEDTEKELASINDEDVIADDDNGLSIGVVTVSSDRNLEPCEFCLTVEGLTEGDKDIHVCMTDRQLLLFTQQLLGMYAKLSKLNDKLRRIGVRSSCYHEGE